MKILLFAVLTIFVLRSNAQVKPKTDTLKQPQVVHVKDVVLTKPGDVDISIDAPVGDVKVSSDPSDQIYAAVEQEPKFAGGQVALQKFIHENLKNPNNVSGRIIATFVVEKDGSLSDIRILRYPADDVAAEAVRALKSCPKWIAGVQNGHAVRVQYTISVPVGDN